MNTADSVLPVSVVLNACGLSPFALKPLHGGQCAVERAIAFAHLFDAKPTILTDAPSARLLQPVLNTLQDASYSLVFLQNATVAEYLHTMDTLPTEQHTLLLCSIASPFLDARATQALYAMHKKYLAQYSFADGYPLGLIPELIEKGCASAFSRHATNKDALPTGNFLFDALKSDINAIDIETMIAPKDVRHLRVSFIVDSQEHFLLSDFFAVQGQITAENYARCIIENERALRLIPQYYALALTTEHPLKSLYLPHQQEPMQMPFEAFTAVIQKIANFSTEAVVSLSVFGEPACYPRIEDAVIELLSTTSLSILIETTGLLWKKETIMRIAEAVRQYRANKKNALMWIVMRDAYSVEMYQKIHQLDAEEAHTYFAESEQCINLLYEYFPESMWVQWIRMRENEAELETFFRAAQQRGQKIIIQKYDSLCQKLPDRAVADLSPLQRHPCWHVKRDMTILSDGAVPLCKEDVSASAVLGNAFTDDLREIWQRGEPFYQDHLNREYKGLCKTCDEYYTYNF